MSALEKLETQLNIWLNTSAPVKLPAGARKAIAEALWIIALVVGLIQLWGVWALWRVGHLVAEVNTYASYLGSSVVTVHLGLFYWLSFIAAAVTAVLLLVATPKLKQMQKSGWNLLYYAALLSAGFAVLRLFSSVDGVFGDFLGAAIGAVLGAYFLFQVRDYFDGKKVHADHTAHPHEK